MTRLIHPITDLLSSFAHHLPDLLSSQLVGWLLQLAVGWVLEQ